MSWPATANLKHGMSSSAEHNVWRKMRQRCNNPTNKNYKEYGERGVSVCAEWDNIDGGFEAFYRDMGPRPEGMTLERRDNDGPYCKENCVWASWTAQARNRRNSRLGFLSGKEMTLAEACEEIGINYSTAHKRLTRMGWPTGVIFDGVLM